MTQSFLKEITHNRDQLYLRDLGAAKHYYPTYA